MTALQGEASHHPNDGFAGESSHHPNDDLGGASLVVFGMTVLLGGKLPAVE
jgi:hypothetical protein